MPSRKIPKNYRNVTGITAAAKAIGQAQFESTLERDLLTLLEFSPEVQKFEVQPLILPWNDGCRDRRYVPDVLVTFKPIGRNRRTPILYEVKYRDELRENWPQLRPKFRAAIRFAKTHGFSFKLITEREIRTPYLTNAKFLLPFLRQAPPSIGDMDILEGALLDLREVEIEELMQAVCRDEWSRARLIPALWYLIGTFEFGVDLHRPLNMKSRIWSNQ